SRAVWERKRRRARRADDRRRPRLRGDFSHFGRRDLPSGHPSARTSSISSIARVEGGPRPSNRWGYAGVGRKGRVELMAELATPPGRFREIARLKLADGHTQGALDTSTARLYGNRIA